MDRLSPTTDLMKNCSGGYLNNREKIVQRKASRLEIKGITNLIA